MDQCAKCGFGPLNHERPFACSDHEFTLSCQGTTVRGVYRCQCPLCLHDRHVECRERSGHPEPCSCSSETVQVAAARR